MDGFVKNFIDLLTPTSFLIYGLWIFLLIGLFSVIRRIKVHFMYRYPREKANYDFIERDPYLKKLFERKYRSRLTAEHYPFVSDELLRKRISKSSS